MSCNMMYSYVHSPTLEDEGQAINANVALAKTYIHYI